LDGFNAKIVRKSTYTRGIFLSINGYTADALTAVRTGGTLRFILLDGAHLFRVLEGHVRLDALLIQVWRRFAERGMPYTPAMELVQQLT
jgi:hypothetical protein